MVARKLGWRECLLIPDFARHFFFHVGTTLRYIMHQCKTKRVRIKVKCWTADRNNLPERPTNAQPQMILQNQPMKRKTMVDNCMSPTKQLTHKTEVRFMRGISWRVRKNAITPDITVPARKRKWHYILDKQRNVSRTLRVWLFGLSFLHCKEIQNRSLTRSSSSTQPTMNVVLFLHSGGDVLFVCSFVCSFAFGKVICPRSGMCYLFMRCSRQMWSKTVQGWHQSFPGHQRFFGG